MSLSRVRPEDIEGLEHVQCSFCGKEPSDVTTLVSGEDAFICGECIAAGTDLIEGEPDEHEAAVFFRLLNAADVAGLVTMSDLIDAMEGALRRFSTGGVVQPVRTVLPLGDRGFFGVMPAALEEPDAVGAKLVTVVAGNAALGLPTHLAAILMFSPQTGALVAMMDGRTITELRTAAVSAVSANLLATEQASVLAILGSGVQARSHLEALEQVFELTEVRVYSPTPEHQLAFLSDMATITKARLVGADSAHQAVSGADIIVLATSSPEPVIQNEWVKSGAHVISVGACRPNQREMDPARSSGAAGCSSTRDPPRSPNRATSSWASRRAGFLPRTSSESLARFSAGKWRDASRRATSPSSSLSGWRWRMS